MVDQVGKLLFLILEHFLVGIQQPSLRRVHGYPRDGAFDVPSAALPPVVLTVDRMMAPNTPLKTPKLVDVNGLGEAWDHNRPSFRGVDLVKIWQLIDETSS